MASFGGESPASLRPAGPSNFPERNWEAEGGNLRSNGVPRGPRIRRACLTTLYPNCEGWGVRCKVVSEIDPPQLYLTFLRILLPPDYSRLQGYKLRHSFAQYPPLALAWVFFLPVSGVALRTLGLGLFVDVFLAPQTPFGLGLPPQESFFC